MLFQTEVQFRMRITPDAQSMMGNVKGLNIVSCIYAPDKRENSKVTVS